MTFDTRLAHVHLDAGTVERRKLFLFCFGQTLKLQMTPVLTSNQLKKKKFYNIYIYNHQQAETAKTS